MTHERRKIANLIIEDHPQDYVGPQWLTLINYAGKTHLVIVDAADKNYLWGYNFDSMDMHERSIFTKFMDNYWNEQLYNEPLRYRIAVHEWMYDKGLGEMFGTKLIGYNINDILRLVGPIRYADPIGEKMHIKRRKRTLVALYDVMIK